MLMTTQTHEGSLETRRTHWRPVHALEGEARYTAVAVRACNVQAALPSCTESLLVSGRRTSIVRHGPRELLTGRQPSRRSRPGLDLPFLPLEEPASPPLQRHYGQCYPSRTPSSQHHD